MISGTIKAIVRNIFLGWIMVSEASIRSHFPSELCKQKSHFPSQRVNIIKIINPKNLKLSLIGSYITKKGSFLLKNKNLNLSVETLGLHVLETF